MSEQKTINPELPKHETKNCRRYKEWTLEVDANNVDVHVYYDFALCSKCATCTNLSRCGNLRCKDDFMKGNIPIRFVIRIRSVDTFFMY
jgi:hypothetical protein